MYRPRGYRGWMAATTVAVTLALVFLVVEKHQRIPSLNFSTTEEAVDELSQRQSGIVLSVDPRLAGREEYPRRDKAIIFREDIETTIKHVAVLRRPPEPAANVVLRAPIASQELAALPMHSSRSATGLLMDAMDEAFDSPMQVASVSEKDSAYATSTPQTSPRLTQLPSPNSLTGRIPKPKTLISQLNAISELVANRPTEVQDLGSVLVAKTNVNVTLAEANLINGWSSDILAVLDQLVMHHGLEHPECARDLDRLAALANQGTEIANRLTDYSLAARLIRAGYSLDRRVQVWQGIQACLDGTTIALEKPASPLTVKHDLGSTIEIIREVLDQTGDVEAWANYLMLDRLEQWVAEPSNIWAEGNQLALNVLSRLYWSRLNQEQQQFLAKPEFDQLASHLVVWSRDPVDYRRLLAQIEQFEENPISRISPSLAGAVQVLRLSDSDKQRQLAARINDHYRNANIRLAVSSDLLERLMPETDFEVRPVRQRILGANTRGASTVKTNLSVQLIPDETKWNIGLGVVGDMYSKTRSSKGPADFYATSTAQINSRRYIQLTPMGYRVGAEPTSVISQETLQRMSTDFDGLPVIGDFARLLVREQFDQKRGLAQRIARRIIAKEADQELDKRLGENLRKAEKQLHTYLVGPLENLNLNPMVVAMNTTDKRLSIRYRIAGATQMAAHTPRPRAPRESLMSVQLNQSALNNAIAQIGLSGRTWTIPELYERLGEVFETGNWEVPADVPTDIKIRFADTRPATIELKDGRARLTLRIAELTRPGRLKIQRFLVSSNYIPVATGLKAELVRDGVVEIVAKRDRLALRLIFAKVFVSKPQIDLISPELQADPRAEGLAVSQLDINAGWLAVAISESDSEMASEVAAKAAELLR